MLPSSKSMLASFVSDAGSWLSGVVLSTAFVPVCSLVAGSAAVPHAAMESAIVPAKRQAKNFFVFNFFNPPFFSLKVDEFSRGKLSYDTTSLHTFYKVFLQQ